MRKALRKLFSLVKKEKLLVSILILAAVLRFSGTNPGYNQYHSDEPIIYGTAVQMLKNGNLDPGRYDYSGVPIYINYLLFRFFFIPITWVGYYLTYLPEIIDGLIHIPIPSLEVKRIFQLYILGDREINALFWGRYVTALFGLGNVLLVYVLGKRLFGKKVGLIAAFLLAFNFKHVVNSHITLPDIYNSFFLLLAILSSFNLWNNPSRRNYLLAGVATGLSFAAKYQIFGILPFGLVHFFLSIKKGKIDIKNLFFNPNFLMSVLFVPLIFFLTNPYFFTNLEEAFKWLTDVSRKYGMGRKKVNLFLLSYAYRIDYGGPELLVILMGMVVMLRNSLKKALFLLSPIILFTFIFFFYSTGGFYVRNLITITPVLLVFAASGVYWFISIINERIGHRVSFIIIPIVLATVIFVPARNSIIHSYYYTKPWNYNVLSDWLFKNMPRNEVVAAHPFDPPTGAPPMKKTEFEISGNYSLAEHKENGASYALVNAEWAGNPFYFWMIFGPKEVDLLWSKPTSLLRNMYHGLAMEELFRYQIFSAVKPWQAPDSGLVLARLPNWPDVEMRTIKQFKFDDDLERWVIYGKLDSLANYELDEANGSSNPGSIVFIPGKIKYPIIRIVSEPIQVKQGYLYKVTGFLRSEEEFSLNKRDGFLRVDFYSDGINTENVGVISSVSSRVYGTNEWVGKEIMERAPAGVQFMTVSFQAGSSQVKMWVDDILAEESVVTVEDVTSEPPYIKKEIDLDVFYPNSHGNL